MMLEKDGLLQDYADPEKCSPELCTEQSAPYSGDTPHGTKEVGEAMGLRQWTEALDQTGLKVIPPKPMQGKMSEHLQNIT